MADVQTTFSTVAEIEALARSSVRSRILTCRATGKLYTFELNGSALTRDGSDILNTFWGGDTRWVAKAGGTLPGGTVNWANVLKAGSDLADLETKSHSDLDDITADDHHAQSHALTGADHTLSGLTAGHVYRASAAAAAGFAAIQASDLPDLSATYSVTSHNHSATYAALTHAAQHLTGSDKVVAGSDTQVQFNDGGALAGDSDLAWNKATNVLTVSGGIKTPVVLPSTDSITAFQIQNAAASEVINVDTTNKRIRFTGTAASSSSAQFVINNTDVTDYSWNKEFECQRNGIAGFSVQTRYHSSGFQYTALTIGSSQTLYIFGNGDMGTGGTIRLKANQVYVEGTFLPSGYILVPRTGDATSVALQKASYDVRFQASLWNGSAAVWHYAYLTYKTSTATGLLARLAFDVANSTTTFEAISIENTAGKVGIGTTTPAARLHVYDDTGGDLLLLYNGATKRFGMDYTGKVTHAGDYAHTGTNFGVCSATPHAQVAHVEDVSLSGTYASDYSTIQSKINTILASLEDFGFHAAA